MKEVADDEHNFELSNTTAILFAIVLIYLAFTALWFIQSRHRVTAACRCCSRQTSFSPLRQLRYLFRNNHKLEYNYDNLPNHYVLDEKEYKSWSILEVASWTRSKLAGAHQLNNTYGAVQNNYMSNQDDDIILQTAIDAIITQRIDGSSLDFITLEFLCRWVPFGTAVRLHQLYNALISGGSYNREENMSAMSNDSSLPSWYRLQSDSSNHDVHDGKSQDSLSSEHAQRIMRERFGLSLPTLRTEEKVLSNPPDDSVLELTERGGSIEENNANLGKILDAMPPHIRAAAERRPELVAELLSNRQSRNVVHNHNHNKGSLLPVHEEDHDEEINVEDIDSESASLLRRRLI
jgi:hypothetical protein